MKSFTKQKNWQVVILKFEVYAQRYGSLHLRVAKEQTKSEDSCEIILWKWWEVLILSNLTTFLQSLTFPAKSSFETWRRPSFVSCLSWQKSHVLHLSYTHVWLKFPCNVKRLLLSQNKRVWFPFLQLSSQLPGSTGCSLPCFVHA